MSRSAGALVGLGGRGGGRYRASFRVGTRMFGGAGCRSVKARGTSAAVVDVRPASLRASRSSTRGARGRSRGAASGATASPSRAPLPRPAAAFALCAPLFESLTGHPVDENNVRNGLDEQQRPGRAFNTNGYWLGADQLGRDLLVRAAYGARTSLVIGITSTTIALLIAGIFAGVAAGFFGRWVDNGISRAIDIMAAFPILLFAICMSVVLGASYATVIGTIAVFSWFYPARIFRGEVLALREREFIDAARMVGASNWRIMRRHIMPHLLGPVIVYGTLAIAAAISFEAALSFLGFGLPADVPSWGRMISDAACQRAVLPGALDDDRPGHAPLPHSPGVQPARRRAARRARPARRG